MLWLVAFSKLKSYFQILIAFLSTKIGKICFYIGLLLLSLFLSYKYGLNNGIDEEKARNDKILVNALKEQEKRLIIEKDEAIKLIESQKKTEKIYIKGKETIKLIKDNNPKLSSKDCSLSKEDAIKLNNSIQEILQ